MLAGLNENFRQYSWGNAEFPYLKIFCIFVKYYLLAANEWYKKDVNKSAATATGFTTEDLIKRL